MLRAKTHPDIVSFISFYVISNRLQTINREARKGLATLTQGVRAALHRLVDLPCNSGHGLTHLLQHADSGVLLPAPRLVCCSQRDLCLAKTQGRQAPTCQPETPPAPSSPDPRAARKPTGKGPSHSPPVRGHRAQATSSLAFAGTDRVRAAGQLLFWEDQHV